MQKQNNSSSDVLKYAGLGAQILVSIGLAVFAGYHADRWLRITFPLLVWALPLIIVSFILYKIIKDTSKNTKVDAD